MLRGKSNAALKRCAGCTPDPDDFRAANRDMRRPATAPFLTLVSSAGPVPWKRVDFCCRGARMGRMTPRASSVAEGMGDGGLCIGLGLSASNDILDDCRRSIAPQVMMHWMRRSA